MIDIKKNDINAKNHFVIEKLNKKDKKNSYEYGIVIRKNDYSLIIKTESYYQQRIKDYSFDFNEPIVNQKLYFLHKSDTLNSLILDSRRGVLRLKGRNKNLNFSKNQLKFITIIEGEKDFFYYLSGGEDCVSGCPEYFAFYDKKGNMLWKNYLKNEGNYSGTLKAFRIKNDLYKKKSIVLIRVTSLKELGNSINSSLIRFIEQLQKK